VYNIMAEKQKPNHPRGTIFQGPVPVPVTWSLRASATVPHRLGAGSRSTMRDRQSAVRDSSSAATVAAAALASPYEAPSP
jgi:hypothetical protein